MAKHDRHAEQIAKRRAKRREKQKRTHKIPGWVYKIILILILSVVGTVSYTHLLSELSPEQVAMAAASGDSKSLTRASGVGAKLAQRIVLELKDKVKKMGGGVLEGFAPAGGVPSAAGNAANAVSALSVLGYTPTDAASVVAKFDSSLPTEELIRLALKEFGKNR